MNIKIFITQWGGFDHCILMDWINDEGKRSFKYICGLSIWMGGSIY